MWEHTWPFVHGFRFGRAATGVRDENLKARALAGAESSRRNGSGERVSSRPVVSLNFPAPPYNRPRISSLRTRRRTRRIGQAVSILFEERITERKSVSPLSTSCPLDELSLRLGCWRRETTRFRRGAHSGTKEVAERPSQAPNGSVARLRELCSRDERAWRKAKRAGAKSAQAQLPTVRRVGHGEMEFLCLFRLSSAQIPDRGI